jgi:hypothetical protein
VEKQLSILRHARPASVEGITLLVELQLAARMAAQSCKYMLWQQSVAAGRVAAAKRIAGKNISELRQLQREFYAYWPMRNQGNHKKYWPCLQWRIEEYRRGVLHFPPEVASVVKLSTSAD